MTNILQKIKSWLPQSAIDFIRPAYHFFLAWAGSVWFRNPTQNITVIGVTGTKGKTTTTELIAHLLEEAGYTVAVSNTIRFSVGDSSQQNKKKMSMPGRFFLQSFFRQAVDTGCEYAVIEMTSEGAKQYRHRFIELDTLVFTNLSPEHIEAHGSFEKYRQAKVSIARQLERSRKSPTRLVINADDEHADHFRKVKADTVIEFRLSDAKPYSQTRSGSVLTVGGAQVKSKLFGTFNIYNIIASATVARAHGVSKKTITAGIETFSGVPGRLESIDAGQDFDVYVDYAHTPDSLEKVYETFAGRQKVCVLGNAGGGRDTWKREKMAKIAENHCRKIFLTDEDPYDENPRKIVDEMAKSITIPKYEIIMDRRKAIHAAFQEAKAGEVVLLTGKGTDPYIMRADGEKEPWDEATIAQEELEKIQDEDLDE